MAGIDGKNIHFRLVNNAVWKNKKGYNVFLKYMKESDTKYWKLVHWDKPLVRCLESNYFSMGIMQKNCKVIRKIKEMLY